MFSLRKTKLQAVSVHQSRFSSLFRAIEVTGTKPQPSLQHGLAGNDVLSDARNHSLLSKLRTSSTRFDVWSIDRTEAFSTISGSILLQARDPAKLNEEIQIAVDQRRCDEAWRLFEQHMQMEGFPRKSVVNNVLVCFAESLDSNWLQKGYTLVEKAFDESKQNLLEKEPLVYLSLALAKSGMSVPASTILRKLVETEEYPHVSAWSAVLAHMSLTGSGSYLSAELVLEIGYLFQNNRVDPRKKSNAPLLAMKPNTQALNIALAGCLLFGTTRKAEKLLDMIPKIGVKADANLLVIMAHIYERNGRREELRKLQRHIDEACNLNDSQFWQFYNCLLMCHLKFGDLEAASKMVLEMLRRGKVARNSLGAAILGFGTAEDDKLKLRKESKVKEHDNHETPIHSMIPYEEFVRDRKFLKLEAEAKDVLGALLAKLHVQVELITSERGVLQPTEEIYVKLAKAFLESGKMKELAEFMLKAEHEDSPVSSDNSMLVNVTNACISLGMLDQAHDLLDEMRMAGVRTGSSVYSSLLKAYCKTNRTREVTALLRDAQKAGIQFDSSCYEALIQSQVIQNDTHGALNVFKEMKEAKLPRGGNQQFEKLLNGCEGNAEAGLMSKLLREIREGQSNLDAGVHDWNNVIHFFSKKGLMQDAEKALKRMRSLGHSPNAQTFHSMVTGYAAIGSKYIEVTELWGEMKSIAAATSSMRFDQELLDAVLYTFVRGGFFSRANEVVEMMEKEKMFVDKYKYRMLFLKYHKTAYKGKAPKVQSESQLRKRESGLTFKKWLGLS
ncbi:pentatricopeptide repeat-containing protein At1g03100, mitochondrial [Raphanus sativus]|uniref:Pentatricopeptide repeat-containing protein At1g03100, mitochondrial n=1 Tax=Raphanus sativus TaxID=3726 RepID=A0A9W3D6H0_RAPSA|nr:pentatricopeptide repeat-containing protein At1g03100, mitochondrial [Raphanus sativus]